MFDCGLDPFFCHVCMSPPFFDSVRKAFFLGGGELVELGVGHFGECLVAFVDLSGVMFCDSHGAALDYTYCFTSGFVRHELLLCCLLLHDWCSAAGAGAPCASAALHDDLSVVDEFVH